MKGNPSYNKPWMPRRNPICSALLYLSSAPPQFIERFEEYQSPNPNELAAQTRKLCNLRSILLDNFHSIKDELFRGTPLTKIPLTARLVNDLSRYDIVHHDALWCHISRINEYIDKNIDNLTVMFNDVPAEWIKELFHMPRGHSEDGILSALCKYRQFRGCYPYQKYINWHFAETSEETRSKLLFNNDKDFMELLTQAHANRASVVCDFVNTADTVVIIDCENSDTQRVYNALYPVQKRLRKIILVDDANNNVLWDVLEDEYASSGVAVEHDKLPRIDKLKSLVDMRFVAKTCEQFYKQQVNNIILVSSDSDIWATIVELSDANIMVLAERDKTSDTFVEALTQSNVNFVFMEDVPNTSDKLLDRVMRKQINEMLSTASISIRHLVIRAAQTLHVTLSREDIAQYTAETLADVHPVKDEQTGRIALVSD